MKKTISILMVLVVSTFIVLAAKETISVKGSAEISAKPDVAYFTITSTFTEDTTEEARNKTSDMIANCVELLEEDFGIGKKDLKTSYISASPVYHYDDEGKQVLVGQRASQSINVTVRSINDIGRIYESLMAFDSITLSDVRLDKENKDGEMIEAMTKAVENAYMKASTYAKAANVGIKKVLSIEEGYSSYTPVYGRGANMLMAAAKAEAADSAPVEYYTGDISVSADVSIIYEIEELKD